MASSRYAAASMCPPPHHCSMPYWGVPTASGMKAPRKHYITCADFHIPGAHTVVCNFVRACAVCQRNKTKQLHPTSLLQQLEIPSAVWSDITMDFIKGFPRINNKSVILTVVDKFSKCAHFIPLGHPYTTAVPRVVFHSIVGLHGISSSIVSDRDPVFMKSV
jgi:hypothetical protein